MYARDLLVQLHCLGKPQSAEWESMLHLPLTENHLLGEVWRRRLETPSPALRRFRLETAPTCSQLCV